MNIFTSGQPMSKTDHFSAVSSLISFISLSLIKKYLSWTWGWTIVNNSGITLPQIVSKTWWQGTGAANLIHAIFQKPFFNQDVPENVRMNLVSD